MNITLRNLLRAGLIFAGCVVLVSGGFAAGAWSQRFGSFAPFWQAWDIVHQEYVTQPVDDTKLMQGAIGGMLQSLNDPFTSYMDPANYQVASTTLSGQFEGIGALLEPAGNYLRIVSPFPGSPAEKAGLQPGDVIVQVDGQDVGNLGETQTIMRVRGPAGSTVHLGILRGTSQKPLEFDIVRAKITVPSVESKMLDGNIAYVKLNDFGDNTPAELQTALTSLMAQKPVGLVLDLRGNPGGLVTTAIAVASQFIPDGVIMRERFADGHENVRQADSGGLALNVPLVVLVNKGSASASEIVAGAIQDRQRGKVLGETSYGKGSEQHVELLQGNNGAVRVTTAHWLTPNGRTIQGTGIAPDVVVARTADDITANRDPQLDAAVNLLLGK
jgi:carboxyl-terminal processing protease